MNTIILVAFCWWVIGLIGYIYVWLNYDDFTVEQLFPAALGAFAGPIIIIFDLIHTYKDRVLLHKREK